MHVARVSDLHVAHRAAQTRGVPELTSNPQDRTVIDVLLAPETRGRRWNKDCLTHYLLRFI